MLVANPDPAQLTATVHALCDLEADDVFSLVKLAQARAECFETLKAQWSPGRSADVREVLQRQCADRGIAALGLAVDRGYSNLQRLEGNPRSMRMFSNLHDQPGFAEIVAQDENGTAHWPVEALADCRAHRSTASGLRAAGALDLYDGGGFSLDRGREGAGTGSPSSSPSTSRPSVSRRRLRPATVP